MATDDGRRRRPAWQWLCLMSTLCTVGVVVRAENCGDPLASCYVGNAVAGTLLAGFADDSRQKYGQSVKYKPTVKLFVSFLLLYSEALDIVRLGPDEPPLTAVKLKDFYRNALKEYNGAGSYASETAINFYEKAGVPHFVYRDGCEFNTWPFDANAATCTNEFYGTYYAKVTSFGEEWVRCTTQIPAYASSLSKINLALDWISCDAYVAQNADGAATEQGRLEASKTPVGGVARVKTAVGDNRWIVVGSDDYLRSPAEVSAEETYGVPGLPQEKGEFCARHLAVSQGGSPFGCNQVTGYDRQMADGFIRRFVTPNWENSNNWTDPLSSYNMGERIGYARWSNFDNNRHISATSIQSAQDHLDFDESPAYPNTLFIGNNRIAYHAGHTEAFDFSKSGVRNIVMWEYAWENPAEKVAAGGPPALPGANATKLILGRWREPQLPWSSPRNFRPTSVGDPAGGSRQAAAKAKAVHTWDPPSVFGFIDTGAPASSRNSFTVSTYVYLRKFTPVYQNMGEGLPGLKLSHMDERGNNVYSGTESIDWGSYFADADAGTQVGNLWHVGREFAPPNAGLGITGDVMPVSGLSDIPAGGYAVKGVSLYVDRMGKLVMVATDRGTTFSCTADYCAMSNCDACADGGRTYGCYSYVNQYNDCRVCANPSKTCTSTDASVKTCTSADAVSVEAWLSVTAAVSTDAATGATTAALWVGTAKACEISLPNGIYIDENASPVYTQCTSDDCGATEVRDGVMGPSRTDHSRRAAAPHVPAAALAEMYDFSVSFGPAAVDPTPLATALQQRAAFAPPTPDGWKKRCQPDCPDPNTFTNHVPIPQGRWTKLPEPRSLKLFGCAAGVCQDPHHCCLNKGVNCKGSTPDERRAQCWGHSSAQCGFRGKCEDDVLKAMTWDSSFKVDADGDIMFLSYKYNFMQGYGNVAEEDSVFAVLRGNKTACAMTGVCGSAFESASFYGVFEKRVDGGGVSLPHWRNQTRLAKENSPESEVYMLVPAAWPEDSDGEHRLQKTGDHKDILMVTKRIYSWHKETPGKMGGWSTNGFHFGTGTSLVSGRSVTHLSENEGDEFYGWAHRRMVDGSNYLQSEIMPLAADSHPSPWACTKWRNVFSPDGGYTYYGVLEAGYDPSTEPLSRCRFGRALSGVDIYGGKTIIGIRRLVTDECKPLVTMNTKYGFASYLGNVRKSNTFFKAGVSRPNGDFLLSGQLGAPGVLGSDASFVRNELTNQSLGCANTSNAMVGKFNESAGAKCMSQVMTLQGAGCVAGDPSASCGAPTSTSFLGDGGKRDIAGDMARASVEGSIVVAGPTGVMKLNRFANETTWNACPLCVQDCHAVCGGTDGEIRVDVGPNGKVVAVLEIKSGFPSVLFILNGTTGAELHRLRMSGANDVFADVAVSDSAGIDKVFVGGYKKSQTVTLGGGFNDASVDVAFVRAYDVATGALAWRTWDYAGSELNKYDAASTRINVMVVDKSGRLFVGGIAKGFTPAPQRSCSAGSTHTIPSNANVFRWDGKNKTGTLFNADKYLGRRPTKTASQTDIHSNIDSPKFSHKAGAYVALIDPISGQVIRGKFTFTRKTVRECPLGAHYFAELNAADDMTLTALDIDAKGNVVFGGAVVGDVENREYQTSNKKRVGRKPSAPEPYFAVLDANLVRRSKWSIPTQRTADAAEGSAKYYQQFGGAGAVAGIVGGAYCPDDVTSFGACTSALLINGEAAGNMGQFYTTANALQVWGENNKWGTNCQYTEGPDCLKTDAYAALISGPAQLGDLSVCNPVDFKEPSVMLLWARFSNARKSIDIKFDSDTDRGETGKLTLGGVFDCSALMCANTTAMLGSGCTAMFLDKRTARITLGAGHTVSESSDGLADGSMIAIRGGVVYSDRFRDRGQSSTASIMVTRRDGEPIAVNAEMDCPSTVSIPNFAGCEDGQVTLSAARSTGRLGDSPLTYKWRLTNADQMVGLTAAELAKAQALDQWLQNRNATSRYLNIPYSMFVPQNRSGCAPGASSLACPGRSHEFSVTVYNKAGHVYTGKANDINAQRTSCSINLFNADQGLKVDWCAPFTPPPKTKGLAAVDACIDATWAKCLSSRQNTTTVQVTWSVTPEDDPSATIDSTRIKGWPTATGLHPEVTAQEAKLTGLAAAEKSNTFNVPKNMLFSGRKYHVHANVAVSWNGVLQGVYNLDRTVRADYNDISSVLVEGNGGDSTEYAAPLANGADSVPVPGVFDSTQLKPSLTRTETLPRRMVKHDETNKVHALSDVRIDPDWRTDVKAPTHVWYCRDMASDRDNCQLRGMTQAVAATAPTSDKLDSFWPSPSAGDEDSLPEGTPLSIPPYAMQDEKEYTFTLMSVKSKRKSLPDMAG